MFAAICDTWEEPMYKLIHVLEETEEGGEHRKRATTQGNQDGAWIYPSPNDLHLLYARILIGLPPQPRGFRYGRYYVDNSAYEGLKQVTERNKDEGGCAC